MSVIQVMNSRPGWGRPAVKRAAPPTKRPAPVRHPSRVTGPWARLWAPELVVSLWAVCWLAVRLRPIPTVPTPADVTVATVAAWWRSIVWPSQGLVVGQVALVVGVVALVVAADVLLLRDCRFGRTGRRLRWLWERAARRTLNEAPRLRHVRRRGGIVDARVVIRGGNWEALETALDADKGTMLRQLKLGRRMGSPFRAEFTSVGCRNPARSRKLRLLYVPLPLPDTFPAWEKPAQGSEMFIAYAVEGPVIVDLEQIPHFQVVGATGAGKGQTIAGLEIQALRAGWLLIVLDGGDSPEHAILDPAPTVMRPMLSEMSPEDRLRAAIRTLKVVRAMMSARSAVAQAFGVTRWVDIPAEVRAWFPRVAIVVDETTLMLGDTKEKVPDDLRKELRSLLDAVLRLGRKFGFHVLPMSDQFPYSKVLSLASQQQAAGVIVLGNMDQGHVRQVAGRALPAVPAKVPRCGHFIEYGEERIREIRVPFHPQALKRAVEYVVAQCGGEAMVPLSAPRDASHQAPADKTAEPTQAEATALLAVHATVDGVHVVWPPALGQRRAMVRLGGRSWPAVNVAWFAETGVVPTAAHNLRPLPTCTVAHCVAARCRCEWAKRDLRANSAP